MNDMQGVKREMGTKQLLSGNEAVAHGAYRAGCRVAAAYPGTPSTEILEHVATFKDAIDCEWSVNEKVAMEVAIGASIAGVRALTAMKHVGLNVALDPLMTYTYIGAWGGLVVVTADDPGMHSSQNEQDNRNLARFARAPLFEPADSQEAYDMTVAAFELSERFQAPVILRLTTRTSHASTLVDLGDDHQPLPIVAKPYKKDIRRNIPVPAFGRPMRYRVEERTAALRAEAEISPFNRIEAGDRRLGILTAGVAYQYVREAFPEFSVLKLGVSHPLPTDLIRRFAASVDRLLVVEELDPLMEEQVCALGVPVVPYRTEMRMMELNPTRLRALRHEVLGDAPPIAASAAATEGLPTRPPVLCAGCSHRGVFYTLHKLGATVTGDIGCYTLGAFPPLEAMDTTVCMGACIGNALGMEKAGLNGRIAAVIGDSTFFHSGLTGLLDVAYNRGRITTVILDNRITAMTGHQDNPGTGRTLMGAETGVVDIATIARALGIRRVETVAAYDLAELERVLKAELDAPEASVVVVRGPCVLVARPADATPYAVDASKCVGCGACFKLGCPAITRGAPADAGHKRFKSFVDPVLCSGCDLCRQVCRFGAIGKMD
jgi:indolepyruvate ferredoxin oxidoreductase alpha subunit